LVGGRVTPLERRARREVVDAYRWYLRTATRAWQPGNHHAQDDAQQATEHLAVVETLVYVVTGESRRVRHVPTPLADDEDQQPHHSDGQQQQDEVPEGHATTLIFA
jgi:hypothetical protein